MGNVLSFPGECGEGTLKGMLHICVIRKAGDRSNKCAHRKEQRTVRKRACKRVNT